MGIMAKFPSGNLRVVCEYVCVVCDVYECVYCVGIMLSVSMYAPLSLSLSLSLSLCCESGYDVCDCGCVWCVCMQCVESFCVCMCVSCESI